MPRRPVPGKGTNGRSRRMVEREAVVVPQAGLHARPAAMFVKEAKSFGSDIVVIKDGREANAKSSLKLMTLGARHGDKVVIRAEGEDEEAAVEALVAILSREEEE
jgi:phosphocarrier protein HPr